ncbi:hypothetical protein ANN_26999 [Periplaneta americana]|uniref:Uncharacterized protein n=1 Tax=Periplaneta americana TaxID=6978 RepID=A0ABQ8RWX4_PERAM|nr:hypothetical protein ANN_26999 [Periplaneta americana]
MRILRKASPKSREIAYLTLVRPLMEYGTTCWDPYRIYQINSLERIQYRAAKFVKGKREDGNDTIKELKWETLENRRRKTRITSLYRAHLGQKAWVGITARLEKPTYYGRNDHDFKIKCRKQKTDVVFIGYVASKDHLATINASAATLDNRAVDAVSFNKYPIEDKCFDVQTPFHYLHYSEFCSLVYAKMQDTIQQVFPNISKEEISQVFRRILGVLKNVLRQKEDTLNICSDTVRERLNRILDEQWIGRSETTGWPARSPDLFPLAFCVLGHLRLVYETPIESEEELVALRSFSSSLSVGRTTDYSLEASFRVLTRFEAELFVKWTSFLDVKGARRVLTCSDWRTGESSYRGQPTRFLSATAASERSSQAALGQGGSRRRASHFCRPGGGHLPDRHFLKSSLLVPLPHRRLARRKPRSLRRAVRTNFPRPGRSRSGIGSSLEETPSRPRPLGRLPARERRCAFVPE